MITQLFFFFFALFIVYLSHVVMSMQSLLLLYTSLCYAGSYKREVSSAAELSVDVKS